MTPVGLTGYKSVRRSTVASFLANLPEFLGAMITDPRTIVAVAEFGDGRYWQSWADQSSTNVVEVVSNLHISNDGVALSESDEQKLRDLGFMEPSVGPHPNWRVETSGIDDLARLVFMSCVAVREVLGELSENPVDIMTWEHKEPHDGARDKVDLR